mgnify:CR=1 FL=1
MRVKEGTLTPKTDRTYGISLGSKRTNDCQ